MICHFHFTLGPVQSFVAQARRTRDFWAGSFVLSWLSAVAMREVIAQHGNDRACIRFPRPDPGFMEWLDGQRVGNGDKTRPVQGSVPNRFTAVVNRNTFDAEKVVQAVDDAWRGLAATVWKQDLERQAGLGSRHIWHRQVEGFWERSWAIVPDETDTAVLDRRKNWRNHMPPEEPGVKCMVMDGWQELSGALSPTRPDKDVLDAFWQAMRSQRDETLLRDLRPDEYLCAIAFIKRRFPRHFERVRIKMPSGWTAHGWKVPQTVPSVVYMAAVPWLAEVINTLDAKDLRLFHDEAKALTRIDREWTIHDEWPTDVHRIRTAVEAKGGAELNYFRALEGGVFFDTSLENPTAFEDRNQARRVLIALRELRRQAGKGPASPFYAVLLMDGDDIGKRMSEVEKQPAITEALASFTKEAPPIVYAHDGFLIYAGGDDVLALLPIDTALSCACALRSAFAASFDQATEKCGTPTFTATLSGAIEFAHMNMPLTRILQDSQDLLKEVAKKGRGRDAIACRVWKPGHKAAEWAMPWAKAVDGEGKVVIQAMAKDFAQQEQSTPFSNRFFYRIRERLELLQGSGAGPNILTADQAVWLMVAEYLGSGVNEGRTGKARITLAQAQETVVHLLNQCRRWRRSAATGGSDHCEAEDRWEADGALLVRFLAENGMDR